MRKNPEKLLLPLTSAFLECIFAASKGFTVSGVIIGEGSDWDNVSVTYEPEFRLSGSSL